MKAKFNFIGASVSIRDLHCNDDWHIDKRKSDLFQIIYKNEFSSYVDDNTLCDQCITVRQWTNRYPFLQSSALILGTFFSIFHYCHFFSICTFFTSCFFQVASFHVAIFLCCNLVKLYYFHAVSFSCCILSYCDFVVSHFFHVVFFFSFFHFFHTALYLCCYFLHFTLFMLQFLCIKVFSRSTFSAYFPRCTFLYSNLFMLQFFTLHNVHVVRFSWSTFFILHNFYFVFFFSCCTLFMLCAISCCTFTRWNVFDLHLHFFAVALCSCCTVSAAIGRTSPNIYDESFATIINNAIKLWSRLGPVYLSTIPLFLCYTLFMLPFFN